MRCRGGREASATTTRTPPGIRAAYTPPGLRTGQEPRQDVEEEGQAPPLEDKEVVWRRSVEEMFRGAAAQAARPCASILRAASLEPRGLKAGTRPALEV